MNHGLTDEQLALEEAVKRFLSETLTLNRLRTFVASDCAFDKPLLQGLNEMGVPGLMTPQEFGGSGLGFMEAALVAEQFGAAAAPAPFISTVVMATQALLLTTNEDARKEWLPRIASGQVRMAVGFASPLSGQIGENHAVMIAGKLNAKLTAMLEADGATHLLVFTADGSAAIVDVCDVRFETQASVDMTRRIASVTINDAAAQPLSFQLGDELAAVQKVLDAGRLAIACDTLGAAQTMLTRSVAYATERQQFGRQIGSFQGVKYMLADMVTQLEPCRSLAWHSAMLMNQGSTDAHVSVLQTRAHVADVAREVSRMAIEVHGGVGFTDMLGMPFWFRRIAFNRQILGTPERCREEAALAQGWV